jgi:hypothetical protein
MEVVRTHPRGTVKIGNRSRGHLPCPPLLLSGYAKGCTTAELGGGRTAPVLPVQKPAASVKKWAAAQFFSRAACNRCQACRIGRPDLTQPGASSQLAAPRPAEGAPPRWRMASAPQTAAARPVWPCTPDSSVRNTSRAGPQACADGWASSRIYRSSPGCVGRYDSLASWRCGTGTPGSKLRR